MYRIVLLLLILPLFSCLGTRENSPEESTTDSLTVPAGFDFAPSVARWYGFSKAAASLTFDDGTYDQYTEAWPILREEGLRGTFYLAAGLIEKGEWNDNGTIRKMMTWDDAAQIAASRCEIGSHSLNHIDMSLPGTDLVTELKGSRDLMEERLPVTPIETFCWPHWRETPEAIREAEKFYISARSGNGIISYYLNRKGGIPSDPPVDMFAVNALGLLAGQDPEEWHAVADEVFRRGSWFVVSYHGIKGNDPAPDDLGWSALDAGVFRDSIRFIRDKGFWVGTFAEVSKYILERDAAVIHVSAGERNLSVSLEDGLNDKVYNQPLSIALSLPGKWTGVRAFRADGTEVSGTASGGVFRTELLPDSEPLFLKPY